MRLKQVLFIGLLLVCFPLYVGAHEHTCCNQEDCCLNCHSLTGDHSCCQNKQEAEECCRNCRKEDCKKSCGTKNCQDNYCELRKKHH